MGKQIRQLFNENDIQLFGDVEADETYVGGRGRNNKRGRGAENKTAVFGMVQRKGKVKARVVPNVKSKTLLPIIADTVKQGSNLITDEFRAYSRVQQNGYNHYSVQHAIKQYVKGRIHTNNIEGFWSQLKRSIDGTHHFVSAKYLQNYVNEFAYRYNHRHASVSLFDLILGQVVRQVE